MLEGLRGAAAYLLPHDHCRCITGCISAATTLECGDACTELTCRIVIHDALCAQKQCINVLPLPNHSAFVFVMHVMQAASLCSTSVIEAKTSKVSL